MTRVLLVAPPYSGHLNPLIAIGEDLRARGMTVSFATGATRTPQLHTLGFDAHPILPHDPGAFDQISNSATKIGSNPLRLASQVRANLEILVPVTAELTRVVDEVRPDVVVADFTAPPAGLVAERAGIPWLTTMPTPFALETRTGTPSHVGGWAPPRHLGHRFRDAAGRTTTHAFKLGVERLFARRFRELGARVYRDDGSEAAYSPTAIFGLGLPELEFERDWPTAFRLVGPITASPRLDRPIPAVFGSRSPGRRRVLVSLGTHLWWAKKTLTEQVCRLAAALPEVDFVVTRGDADGSAGVTRHTRQVVECDYVPYDDVLADVDAVIHHGGAGITYSCLRAGKPAVVWPRDYDQFDFAARIVHARVGLRVRQLDPLHAAPALRSVLEWDPEPLARLQAAVAAADPLGEIAAGVRAAAHGPSQPQ